MYCCGIVCGIVLLLYNAILGVVYFGVWFSEVWCGSFVRCGCGIVSIVSWKFIVRGRGCNVGVVLLRWFGVVSWDCCGVISCCVVEWAVFFSVTLFWLLVTLSKRVL